MKIEQKKFSKANGWETLKDSYFDAADCHFVMSFGSRAIFDDDAIYKTIRNNYPKAGIIMNSTSGEIYDMQRNEDSIFLTAVCVDTTKIKTVTVQIGEVENS